MAGSDGHDGALFGKGGKGFWGLDWCWNVGEGGVKRRKRKVKMLDISTM